MNVREEDRQKSTCASRGLGLAAAAIGVGIGAAMYYFYSKRQQHPHSEGSTSEWNCERQETFPLMESDDSYTTVSENDTTDTSINNTMSSDNVTASEESESDSDSSVSDEEDDESAESDESMDDVEPCLNDFPANMSLTEMTFGFLSPDTHNYSLGELTLDDTTTDNITGDMTFDNSTNDNILGDISYNGSDSDSSSEDVSFGHYVYYDVMTPIRSAVEDLNRLFDTRNGKAQEEHAKLVNLRQQAFRERSWTLEECSICFDVMLRNQEVMSLPCTHNFHTGCILPWLQEKQTCPVCRKTVD